MTGQTDENGRCALAVAPADLQSVTVSRAGYESVSVVAPASDGEVRVVTRPVQERVDGPGRLGPALRFDPPTDRASLLTSSGGSLVVPALQGVTLAGFPRAGAVADFVASSASSDDVLMALSTARARRIPAALTDLHIPAPQAVTTRAGQIVLDLTGSVRVAPQGRPYTRVELDQPVDVGSFGKGAFYQPSTRCDADGTALRCSFAMADHPDFHSPWMQLDLPAAGGDVVSIQVVARMGGDSPQLEIPFDATPTLSGNTVDSLRVDATSVAGRAVTLELEPTASTTPGVSVWMVHYPSLRTEQSLALPPIPAAFAQQVRASPTPTIDVRVRIWSPIVATPWSPEAYALTPRASVISRARAISL